jgi:hypothetical protein
MFALDFEYDEEFLKDWGFIICNTGERDGMQSNTGSSNLVFNTTPMFHGKVFNLTSSKYEDAITLNFKICKHTTNGRMTSISHHESAHLKRWLCRPEFYRFRLLCKEWQNLFVEGSFQIEDVFINGELMLLDLTLITNRPFALHETVKYEQELSANTEFLFRDISDEIGYIYPDIEIKCLKNGDLKLYNSNENRETIIYNCKKNEVITFTRNLVFSSSLPTHKLQSDFNYVFYRIGNSYSNAKNTLTSSLPIEVRLEYNPYVKVVF